MNSTVRLVLRAQLNALGRTVDESFQERFDQALGVPLVLPRHPREVWQPGVGGDSWVRIRPASNGWTADVFQVEPAAGEAVRLNAFGMRLLGAVSASASLDLAMRRITQEIAAADELLFPIVVLMSPSGDPIYAGGEYVDYRGLLALERSRRNGAPTVIWQGYDEDRVIVDPDWYERIRSDDRFAPTRDLLKGEVVGCYVSLPLHDDRRGSFGAVGAVLRPDAHVDASDIRRWSLLADQVALAIRYSELVRRSRSQGSDSERLRIWNDVHAGVAQDVFALSLEVARVDALTPGAIPEALQLVERIESSIGELLSTTTDGRSLLRFDEQLRGHCSSVAQASGITVTCDDSVSWDTFDSTFLEDVERIVVEALRNAVKHARASNIAVVTSRDPDSGDLLLTVTDDGVGGAIPNLGGRGLFIMDSVIQERAGKMTLDSVEGRGTSVQVRVQPLLASEWAVVERSLTDSDS